MSISTTVCLWLLHVRDPCNPQLGIGGSYKLSSIRSELGSGFMGNEASISLPQQVVRWRDR